MIHWWVVRPMTIKNHNNTVEGQFFMIMRGLMKILPGKRFFLYIVNLSAKLVNLPKFMIVPLFQTLPRGLYVHATRNPEGYRQTCIKRGIKTEVKTNIRLRPCAKSWLALQWTIWSTLRWKLFGEDVKYRSVRRIDDTRRVFHVSPKFYFNAPTVSENVRLPPWFDKLVQNRIKLETLG